MLNKVIRNFQQEGMRSTIRKVMYNVTHFHKRFNVTQLEKVDLLKLPAGPSFEDIVKADYINNPYRKPAPLKKEKLKIAWVTPPVGPGGGGHTTISRFVKYLQEQGHRVRFYLYLNNTVNQSLEEARVIFLKSYGIDIEVRDLKDFEDEDVVFATSWDTAYGVFSIKDPTIHKFYFVQDFEPVFYGLGSRYKLAEETYKFGFYGITAGRWLPQKVKEYGMESDFFDFGADLDIYRPKGTLKKKKQIAFYARAHTERRGFEIGVMALKIFKDRHPDYEIIFFGQDMSAYDIPFEFTDRGILSKTELAEIYHESIACLVLSLTNVSLLPMELLVAGCVPVMNDGDNNTMVLGENDDILYAPAFPLALADRLSEAVSLEDIDQSSIKMSEKYSGNSWEESYKKVESIILREVTEG